MENNFKPGDLALLIGTGSKNNFKTVELLEFLGRPARIPLGNVHLANTRADPIWLVRSCRDPLVFRKATGEVAGIPASMVAPVAERQLMPLRDDHAPDQQLVTGKPELVSA